MGNVLTHTLECSNSILYQSRLCVYRYCILGYVKITYIGTVSFRWINPFWYFCLQTRYKARLALYRVCKQKYQKGFIYQKLRVDLRLRTSEREGKLSNPRVRAPRARDAWRKFTEIYRNPRDGAARAPCIDFLLVIGTVCHGRRGFDRGTARYSQFS